MNWRLDSGCPCSTAPSFGQPPASSKIMLNNKNKNALIITESMKQGTEYANMPHWTHSECRICHPST